MTKEELEKKWQAVVDALFNTESNANGVAKVGDLKIVDRKRKVKPDEATDTSDDW